MDVFLWVAIGLLAVCLAPLGAILATVIVVILVLQRIFKMLKNESEK